MDDEEFVRRLDCVRSLEVEILDGKTDAEKWREAHHIFAFTVEEIQFFLGTNAVVLDSDNKLWHSQWKRCIL